MDHEGNFRTDVLSRIFVCRQPRYQYFFNQPDDKELYLDLAPFVDIFDKPEEYVFIFLLFILRLFSFLFNRFVRYEEVTELIKEIFDKRQI